MEDSQRKDTTFDIESMASYDASMHIFIANEPIVCFSPQICYLPENTTSSPTLYDCNTMWSVPSFLAGLSIGASGIVISACVLCYLRCNSRNHPPSPGGAEEVDA